MSTHFHILVREPTKRLARIADEELAAKVRALNGPDKRRDLVQKNPWVGFDWQTFGWIFSLLIVYVSLINPNKSMHVVGKHIIALPEFSRGPKLTTQQRNQLFAAINDRMQEVSFSVDPQQSQK